MLILCAAGAFLCVGCKMCLLCIQQADACPNTGPPQQQQQQQQPIGRPAPQQRLGPIRKVTMATGGVQNQQQAGRGMANQTNRV